jgi:1-aminocyclopropane-1-carboxylate deaminase/D-cysteine desulfhydrase-like pyridoxal-dependent ACC family enzyme
MALAHGAIEESSESIVVAPQVHAIGVCDNPDYFYGYVANIADEMGIQLPGGMTTESFVRKHMIAHQGKGLGYASNTPEELDFITQMALETGIVLDPVYSGKALYHFFNSVLQGEEAEQYRGKNILFWHTGTYRLICCLVRLPATDFPPNT